MGRPGECAAESYRPSGRVASAAYECVGFSHGVRAFAGRSPSQRRCRDTFVACCVATAAVRALPAGVRAVHAWPPRPGVSVGSASADRAPPETDDPLGLVGPWSSSRMPWIHRSNRTEGVWQLSVREGEGCAHEVLRHMPYGRDGGGIASAFDPATVRCLPPPTAQVPTSRSRSESSHRARMTSSESSRFVSPCACDVLRVVAIRLTGLRTSVTRPP